jgi:hypothetical protein
MWRPSIEGTEKFKGTVVSAARARWKEKHGRVTENMIRMVRFVWMRDLKLHKRDLGACLEAGLLRYSGDKLAVSTLGERLLRSDRRMSWR